MKFNLNIFLLIIFVGVLTISCDKTGKSKDTPAGYDLPVSQSSLISPEELNKLEEPVVIVDVRTAKEYKSGHIEGAQLMDIYKDDFKANLETLDKKTPVYVYCKKGGRSAKAARIMQDMGFEEIYDLEGGIRNWNKQNFDLVKE